MEKKQKATKESLVRENARLLSVIETWAKNDESTRRVLSELLDSYEWVSDGYNSYSNSKTQKKIIVRDWIGISFLIGELKADADYAMCIEARESLKRQIEELQQEIMNLKNPPKPTP